MLSLFTSSLLRLILFVFILSFVQATVSLAQEPDELLNTIIKEKGGRWVAGKTSVSNLTLEQKRKLASFTPPASPGDAPSFPPVELAQARAPAQFDWRSQNGHNYVTPVRDQRTCGSCWAFAVTAGLEAKVLISQNIPDRDVDLSEQMLVSCDGANHGCQGGDTYASSAFIRDNGLPPETCYPYANSDGTCGTACPDWRQNAYRISSYSTVAPSLDAIRNAIASSGPVPCMMELYEDFFHYTSGVYEHVSGQRVGGHAVAIVGYNDLDGCFMAKNSWGTGWGEGGFFRIAYGEVNTVTLFGSWAVVYGAVIQPATALAVSPARVNFEPVVLPDSHSRSVVVTLTNTGTSTLTGISLYTDDRHFSVSPATVAALPAGASAQATVLYTATSGTSVDSGSLTIVYGGAVQTIALSGQGNTRPLQPTNLAPADGSVSGGESVILWASPFFDEDGDKHEGSRWIVRDQSGRTVYASRVEGEDGSVSDFDTVNQEKLSLPPGVLTTNGPYYWQVIYRDKRGATSLPSAPTSLAYVGPVTGGAEAVAPSSGGGGGGGCFIATAVYGTREAWEVKVFTHFRDTWLVKSGPGRKAVEFYYRYSQPAASYVARHTTLRAAARLVLTPLAYSMIYPILVLVGCVCLAVFLIWRSVIFRAR